MIRHNPPIEYEWKKKGKYDDLVVILDDLRPRVVIWCWCFFLLF